MKFERIEELGSSNYKDLVFEVKALYLHDKLSKKRGSVRGPASDAWTAGDEKALTTIQLRVEKNQRPIIRQ